MAAKKAKKRPKKRKARKRSIRKKKRIIKRKTGKKRVAKRRLVGRRRLKPKKRRGARKAKVAKGSRKRLKKRISTKGAVQAVKPRQNIVGVVTHYFPKVRAAVVKLKTTLNVGDNIRINGHTTDFNQTVTSMQIDRQPISSANKGQEIGLLVDSRVRRRDVVSKQ